MTHSDGPDPDKSANILAGERHPKNNEAASEAALSRSHRSIWAFRHSALTRRIVIFNLIALNILIAAVLYFS